VTAPPSAEFEEFGLAGWTADRIDAECQGAYQAYVDGVRQRHISYFAARPEQRSETRAFVAHGRPAAFPDGWEDLAGVLPAGAWHRHHLSAVSSQVLAVALLASASRVDPSLAWLSGGRPFRRPLEAGKLEVEDADLQAIVHGPGRNRTYSLQNVRMIAATNCS
jgi:hypothetical protein